MRLMLVSAYFLVFDVSPGAAQGPLPQQGLVGEWVNTNPKTRALRRLVVSRQGEGWSIAAWGHAAIDGEIAWEKVKLTLLGEDIETKALPYGFATWEFGWNTTHLILRVAKEELVVERLTIFKDKSGRSNYRMVEKFKKK